MEKRIKKLSRDLKGKGTKKEIAQTIQTLILYDTNNQLPLDFILEHME